MSTQVSLDELIRSLKETSAIGEEQMKSTTKSTVDFITMLVNNAVDRRKPKITVTQKSNGNNNGNNSETDNFTTDDVSKKPS